MGVWSQVARPADGAAWVTGASAGIGRALTLALADRGWTVHATARNAEALAALAAERPGRIVAQPGDVADAARMAEIVAAIEAETPLALAVLNAGVYLPMRAQEFDAGKVAQTFAINVVGAANGLDPVLKAMIARGKGQVALSASVAGYRGLPRAAAYSASKAALIAMAEALAFDLIDLGVRLSVINPGFVETEATSVNDFDMPFLMAADKAAAIIRRGLARDDARIVFPWQMHLAAWLLAALPPAWTDPILNRKLSGREW